MPYIGNDDSDFGPNYGTIAPAEDVQAMMDRRAALEQPVTAVICESFHDKSARELWPGCHIAHPGSPMLGYRFDRIIVLWKPPTAREAEWLDHFRCKLKPGGALVWLV